MPQTDSLTLELETAHVLYLDFATHQSLSAEDGRRIGQELERTVTTTAEFDRAHKLNQLSLQSGEEGLAALFFEDPEAPVRCAVELSRLFRARGAKFKLRMAVHTGLVYRAAGLRANRLVPDGGVRTALAISDFGDDGHILVSDTTADLLKPLTEWPAALHDLGKWEGPDGTHFGIFNCYADDFGNSEVPRKLKGTSGPTGGSAADPMIGCEVTHYKVVNKLGGGGMGVVYEAQDLRLGRRVALKFLPQDQWQSRPHLERFMQEARAASSLNHPNICIVHDVGDFEGHYFIVMELLEGETLRYLIKQKQLSAQQIVRYGVQIADALSCAHAQGIIHRDIKPANIFVSPSGQLKVLDFGLAKFTSRKLSEAKSLDPGSEDRDELTKPGEFVGTVSYMSPEQARGLELDSRSDLFSFGVVLYEMATGTPPFFGDTSAVVFEALLNRAPMSPVRLNPALPRSLERIINRALEKDRNARYGSAMEMRTDLERSLSQPAPISHPNAGGIDKNQLGQIALLCKRNAQPDEQLLNYLEARLRTDGYKVYVDHHLEIDVKWALETEKRVRDAQVAVVLLSAEAAVSEMLAYEVLVAHEAAQKAGHPRILPVRIDFETALPPSLSGILSETQCVRWQRPEDNESLLARISELSQSSRKVAAPHARLESVGGAVPLDSKFYIVRPTDEEFYEAIGRRDSIVLVKGARQMGKTSLMARGLQEARKSGARVILTDFQKLNSSHLESIENFFMAVAEAIVEQLDWDISLADTWNPRRGPSMNFERFLRREILAKLDCPLVWGMDEIDRLFTCSFGSEVFGLFRSWHNERSLDPSGPWQNLTLAIGYATEAHMFITDMNQSPFNVGTRLALSDFTLEQVTELNRRYESPLQDETEITRFYDLVSGQPYLTRRGLHELVTRKLNFRDFEVQAADDEGPFGDHLRRVLVSLSQDNTLLDIMRASLSGKQTTSTEAFYRLRSAGLVAGDSARDMKPRCELYRRYFARHLL